MGAIISRKKGRTEQNILTKTQAVQAFSGVTRKDHVNLETSGKDETHSAEGNGISAIENPRGSNKHHPDSRSATPGPDADSNVQAVTTIQSHFRGYKERKKLREQKDAALVIQRHVRGHQVRQAAKKDHEAAITIQKRFRVYLSHKNTDKKIDRIDEEKEPEVKDTDRPWKRVSTPPRKAKLEMKMGEKTKESFENYQDDISSLRWQGEQQLEQTTLGDGYKPQRVLLVASNVQEHETLLQAAHSGVRCLVYDFAKLSYEELLQEVQKCLDGYRVGSKAKAIGFVCQGEPGVVYVLRGKALTLKKLELDTELRKFFYSLGHLMSKLDPANTYVHFISNNVGGNKKGERMLVQLEKVLQPNKVKFKSLVFGKGDDSHTLDDYFEEEKFISWQKLKTLKAKTNL